MSRPKTHTVEEVFTARDGTTRAYVRDHALPVFADSDTKPGDAVVVVGGRAVKP